MPSFLGFIVVDAEGTALCKPYETRDGAQTFAQLYRSVHKDAQVFVQEKLSARLTKTQKVDAALAELRRDGKPF